MAHSGCSSVGVGQLKEGDVAMRRGGDQNVKGKKKSALGDLLLNVKSLESFWLEGTSSPK